jgi:hypothetical protein
VHCFPIFNEFWFAKQPTFNPEIFYLAELVPQFSPVMVTTAIDIHHHTTIIFGGSSTY